MIDFQPEPEQSPAIDFQPIDFQPDPQQEGGLARAGAYLGDKATKVGQFFVDEVMKPNNETKSFLGHIFQNTYGSKGVLGLLRSPGQALAYGLSGKDAAANARQINQYSAYNQKLWEQLRGLEAGTPEYNRILSQIKGNQMQIDALSGNTNSLDEEFKITPKMVAGRAINSAVTMAGGSAAKLAKGAMAAAKLAPGLQVGGRIAVQSGLGGLQGLGYATAADLKGEEVIQWVKRGLAAGAVFGGISEAARWAMDYLPRRLWASQSGLSDRQLLNGRKAKEALEYMVEKKKWGFRSTLIQQTGSDANHWRQVAQNVLGSMDDRQIATNTVLDDIAAELQGQGMKASREQIRQFLIDQKFGGELFKKPFLTPLEIQDAYQYVGGVQGNRLWLSAQPTSTQKMLQAAYWGFRNRITEISPAAGDAIRQQSLNLTIHTALRDMADKALNNKLSLRDIWLAVMSGGGIGTVVAPGAGTAVGGIVGLGSWMGMKALGSTLLNTGAAAAMSTARNVLPKLTPLAPMAREGMLQLFKPKP